MSVRPFFVSLDQSQLTEYAWVHNQELSVPVGHAHIPSRGRGSSRPNDRSITIWVFDGCPITNVCFFHMLAAGKSEVLSASLSGRDCVLLNGSCRCGVPDSSILNYLL